MRQILTTRKIRALLKDENSAHLEYLKFSNQFYHTMRELDRAGWRAQEISDMFKEMSMDEKKHYGYLLKIRSLVR